jgi:Chromatin remodelling complex Rsc7/Swp82 subunit
MPTTQLPAQTPTPQLSNQTLPAGAGTQISPPRTTPTKNVVKALPTVRDHTTDQLGPEGDEYVPREVDEAGDKKVQPTGHLNDGREYKCRTFLVPNRGEKLFMLATECARVLSYRDSYLLFNKNRSLYKIIATQAEKDDLIQQEILPYSYRSRQIAIVTARSMFRQFGSRVIRDGRRVRDDYWEAKARKQGFTEEDLAGEKRPGAAKARAAAEASNAIATSLNPNEVSYIHDNTHYDLTSQPQSVQPGLAGATSLAPLPMIQYNNSDDPRMRELGAVPRPRHEISGPAYVDRMQPSNPSEMASQAQSGKEYNSVVNQQRLHRDKMVQEFYKAPRVPAAAPTQQPPPAGPSDHGPPTSQIQRSPQVSSSGIPRPNQQAMMHPNQHTPSHMMSAQSYSQQPPQPSHLAQSPSRGMGSGSSIRPEQLQQRPPSLSSGIPGQGGSQYPQFGQQQNMWPQMQPPHTQHSPLHQPHQSLPQFSPHGQQQQQHSPLPQQSPHHAPPQLHQSHSNSQMAGGSMQYQGGMPGMQGGYPGPQSMYNASPSPQYFSHQSQPGPPQNIPGAYRPPQQTPQGQQQQWWSGA